MNNFWLNRIEQNEFFSITLNMLGTVNALFQSRDVNCDRPDHSPSTHLQVILKPFQNLSQFFDFFVDKWLVKIKKMFKTFFIPKKNEPNSFVSHKQRGDLSQR